MTDQTGEGETETGVSPTPAPAPRQSENPPVGEPLVVSRRNPDARPAVPRTGSPAGGVPGSSEPPAAGPSDRDVEVGSQEEVHAVPVPAVEPPEPPMVGTTVLVTGAGGTVGSAIARELVARGARVLLLHPDAEALVATLDTFPTGHVVPLLCDLVAEGGVSSVAEFVSRATMLDVVIHVTTGSAGSPGFLDDPDRGVHVGLSRDLREQVLVPLELASALGSSLPSGAPMVLVRDADIGSVLHRVAPDLVRERVGSRCRIWDVERDTDLAAERFAAVLVDLLSLDDVGVDRVALVDGAPDSSGDEGVGR